MAKGSILYMEDEAFFGQVLSEELVKSDYEVALAKNGKEGMEKLNGKHFDLVLLDLLMPEMDGFEVLKAMRADPKLKDTPVVVLSNLGEQEDFNKTKEFGVAKFMVKALTDPKIVAETVDQLMAAKPAA